MYSFPGLGKLSGTGENDGPPVEADELDVTLNLRVLELGVCKSCICKVSMPVPLNTNPAEDGSKSESPLKVKGNCAARISAGEADPGIKPNGSESYIG